MKLPVILYCNKPSSGAAALAAALPCYRADNEGFWSRAGERAFRRGAQIINWGTQHCTYNEDTNGPRTLNYPFFVSMAISKYNTCTKLKEAGVPTIEVTRDIEVAEKWHEDGKIVLHRRDGGTNGEGITVIRPNDREVIWQQQGSQFFAKYFKKTHEFRFHVFKGVVIDTQQKRRSRDRGDDYDPMIRSHDRGWTFCRELSIGTEAELALMKETAIKAVAALSLDFGAVDMLARFGTRTNTLKAHAVCEINTRPGIEGTTVTKYAEAIRNLLNSRV